ncbi:glycosyltransferase [Anaerovorax sp. IOR16]|uniref:glycosyltransferase n=1 Tax=Anaerovorax sp. IOR16 TaxID=2773458 RepID=UPI0019D13BA9|nr:glycosyltransferase [Anaerovorax sp. IOR16]
MKKKVWLITHDNYIDRRIFFFADVFQANGCDVKLFGANYFVLDTDDEPNYVVRPTQKKIVKQYRFDLEQLDSEQIRRNCMEIISKQRAYFTQEGKYASSLRELNLSISIDSQDKFFLKSEVMSYFMVYKSSGYRLVYSSLTNQFQYGTEKTYPEYESAIWQYLDLYGVEERSTVDMNGIMVNCRYNQYGELIYSALKQGVECICKYNLNQGTLETTTPIVCSLYQEDQLADSKFNFTDFKGWLFEYSNILERVKRELEVEQPDYVYVADLPTLPIGIILKKTIGCRLIVDCHEWWYKQTMLWEGHLKQKVELAKHYELEMYPQCDICITVGKLLASDMERCYSKAFGTIYSCMNESLSTGKKEPKSDFWNKKFGIDIDSKVAIFQGGMTTLRNLDNLARATKHLKEKQYLVIVGDGAYKEEFVDILRKEGKEEKVLFAGWVRQTELNQYTLNASLGIIPYHASNDYYAYSVPNKLMEYYETKVPILYDKTMLEIDSVVNLQDRKVGICADLSNGDSFGQVIADVLADDALLASIKNNYKLVKSPFNYQGQKYILEQILEGYFDDLS